MRKGIILAGGAGTLLYPSTVAVSKQLLPVYDKPMVYYPLSTLMLAGIRQVLVVSTPQHTPLFEQLLGSGERWGIEVRFAVQPTPGGIAQGLLIGAEFLGDSHPVLALGDNVFHGERLPSLLEHAGSRPSGATVFTQRVRDPDRYGVIELDTGGRAIGIEEKPANPRSNEAVTGLYFYDRDAVVLARSLRPSARGELEITDLNRRYIERGALVAEPLGGDCLWIDAGNHDSLLEAGRFVAAVEQERGIKVGCPEEIAYRKGWIGRTELEALAAPISRCAYGRYLLAMLQE